MSNAPYLDLEGQDYLVNPRQHIETLRQQSHYALNDTGYVFFNQKEAQEVLRSKKLMFSYFHLKPEDNAYLADRAQDMLLAKHGEDHMRLRTLVRQALSERVINDLTNDITAILNELLSALPDDGEVDLVKDFASPFPCRVLGPMLGVPYEDTTDLNRWIEEGAKSIDLVHAKHILPEIEHGWRKLEEFLLNLLEERRLNPGGDIFSELIKAEEDGDKLSKKELTGIASELTRAGVETTRNQLAIILHQLLIHPDQWELLIRDPSLARNAIEEGMRFAPPAHVIPQEATCDLEICGLPLKKGEIAMIHIPAVNRDPLVHNDADHFNILRDPGRHFAFGMGAHFCIGAQLARLEMTLALDALARRVESVELIEEPVVGLPSQGFSPKSLRVKIKKRQ